LVAGVGNLLRGDDGFGCEVARRMGQRPSLDGVSVIDFGIRGFDLTYALLDPWDAVILVDATPRGRAPGTLYVLEPTLTDTHEGAFAETHGMNPLRVLAVARNMGGVPRRLRLVGCEPETLGDEDEPLMQLSAVVAAAVAPAIALIDELVTSLRAEGAERHA
jgi:hydrogenase maturation protease